jgi:periplasmic copper chaperone A
MELASAGHGREILEIVMLRQFFFAAVGTLVAVSYASAHITLETREAAIGGSYKAVMRVPHGCDGSATTAIRIRIPEGVIGVKPMPKAGWTLNVVSGKYPRPYGTHGAKLTEGVTEIGWSGGKLPDAYYDEFVFTGTIAEELEAGKTIYFPVVQECEKGVHRWIEIPAGGHSHADDESSTPAPGLRLLPKR